MIKLHLLGTNKDISNIFYVGRTKKFEKRIVAHKNKKFKAWSVIFLCKNYGESRVMEQAVLSACIAEHIFEMHSFFAFLFIAL